MSLPSTLSDRIDTNRKITQSSVYFATYLSAHSDFNIVADTFCLNQSDDPFSQHLALNNWLNPQIKKFNSITHASKLLQNELKNWVLVPNVFHRKASLIESKLAKVPFKKIPFLNTPPKSPLGHWLLLNEHTLLLNTACTSATANGIYEFVENKTAPPSRAYLKLWELFTRLGLVPDAHSRCIDLGSSPGGWTWVLSQLTKHVISIDKSKLDLSVNKKIQFIQDDILKQKWKSSIKDVEWVFCDAALSPEKLIPMFLDLIEEYPEINFVCTLKQKGNELTELTKKVASLKNTKLIALSANKHELTWFKVSNSFRTLQN